jgi:hypothetical protein
MKILKDSLNTLTEMIEPGKIKDLPYRWLENDFSWQYWPGVVACYLDKRKSKFLDETIWRDENGKSHRKVELIGPIPGWTTDWIR